MSLDEELRGGVSTLALTSRRPTLFPGYFCLPINGCDFYVGSDILTNIAEENFDKSGDFYRETQTILAESRRLNSPINPLLNGKNDVVVHLLVNKVISMYWETIKRECPNTLH